MPPSDDPFDFRNKPKDEGERPRDRPRRESRDEDDDRPRPQPEPEEVDDDRRRPRRDREDDYDDDDRPRRRRRRDDYDDYGRRRDEPAIPGNGFGITSLVLGILSLGCGPLLGLPAIICAVIALGKAKTGVAKGGLATGVLGTVFVPVVVYFLVIPAMEKVRTQARVAADANKMKQQVMGFHNYADGWGRFPSPSASGSDPKQGLSYRVDLLPYIEQGSLYGQFDIKQPWDSPVNQSAGATVVRTYNSPLYPQTQNTNETPYHIFVGGGAVFSADGTKPSIFSITDGTSNTILFVNTPDLLTPWAAPREVQYDPKGQLPSLVAPGAGGTNVAFADGTVKFLKEGTLSQAQIHARITAFGGEQLTGNW